MKLGPEVNSGLFFSIFVHGYEEDESLTNEMAGLYTPEPRDEKRVTDSLHRRYMALRFR